MSSHFASVGGVISPKQDSASYSFTNATTRTGVNYYRIRIIDTIGNATLSNIIAVQLAAGPGMQQMVIPPGRFNRGV